LSKITFVVDLSLGSSGAERKNVSNISI